MGGSAGLATSFARYTDLPRSLTRTEVTKSPPPFGALDLSLPVRARFRALRSGRSRTALAVGAVRGVLLIVGGSEKS